VEVLLEGGKSTDTRIRGGCARVSVCARKLARKNTGCRLAWRQPSASVIVPAGAADRNSTHSAVAASGSRRIPVDTDDKSVVRAI